MYLWCTTLARGFFVARTVLALPRLEGMGILWRKSEDVQYRAAGKRFWMEAEGREPKHGSGAVARYTDSTIAWLLSGASAVVRADTRAAHRSHPGRSLAEGRRG